MKSLQAQLLIKRCMEFRIHYIQMCISLEKFDSIIYLEFWPFLTYVFVDKDEGTGVPISSKFFASYALYQITLCTLRDLDTV